MDDSTHTTVRRRVRLGAGALTLSGILFLTSPFLVVGTIEPPDETRVITVASAVNANSIEWRVGMAIAFVAYASLILGLFGLYAHLARTAAERWALTGLVVSVVSIVLYLPLLGVVTYALPAAGALVESRGAEAMAVIDRTWTDPFIVLPFLAGFAWHVGVAVFGAAVWRAGTPSRPAGIVLVLGSTLGALGYFDVIVIQFASLFVLAAGLILVGVTLWRAA